jgi:site-specific DNA-methyltransferase (adenine-specific)
MENFLNKIINGNSLEVLKTIPDNSIDCCITSPPYWGLRDYGHEEQLGSEKHFKDFVNNLCNVFDEVQRVLKPTGTCFVNLGDTYGTQSGGMAGGFTEPKYGHTETRKVKQPNINMHKSLCLVPERFAIEMIDRGWTIRNQIIWHKPNQMPSSAKDRFTVDFEKVFFFVKQPTDYYFEQQLEKSIWAEFDKRSEVKGGVKSNGKTASGNYATNKVAYTEGGMRNVRTVWTVNTEPSTEAHFATYPQRLVERMIKAGCPENGLVIDPFFGSGTTGIYARKVNRNFVGIELNPEYVEIANKRLFKELGMFA